jgi:hypothetical protein
MISETNFENAALTNDIDQFLKELHFAFAICDFVGVELVVRVKFIEEICVTNHLLNRQTNKLQASLKNLSISRMR